MIWKPVPAQESRHKEHLGLPTTPAGSGPVVGRARPSLRPVMVQAQGGRVTRTVPREIAQVAHEGRGPEAKQGSTIAEARRDPGRVGVSQRPRRATWWRWQGLLAVGPWAALSFSFPYSTQVRLGFCCPFQLVLASWLVPRMGSRAWGLVVDMGPRMSTAFLTLCGPHYLLIKPISLASPMCFYPGFPGKSPHPDPCSRAPYQGPTMLGLGSLPHRGPLFTKSVITTG